jgi:PAS domain S-box-containing protein
METGAEDTPLHSLTVVTDVTERRRAEEALRTAYDDLERRVIERTQALTDTITELRHTEAALRDSEERFRAGFEHAAVGLAMVDAKGRYQLVNPALCQFLGYTESELLTLDRILITHPDDRQASKHHCLARAVGGDTDSAREEKRYLHKDGHVVWGDVSIPLMRVVDGGALYTFGQIQDITESKKIEEALRENEEQMRVITDALPALIGYSDFTHHYRFVDKHYEAQYGVKQKDIVGRHISEIIGEDLLEFTLPYRSAALGGEEVTFEDDFVDARGKHLFYEATYIPHFDDGGEVLGCFAFINDITERKQAEEERRRAQRLTALGNMVGGIAHNLDNLLVPIQALSELAFEEFPEESPSREDMRRVVRSSRRAKELIGRILQFGHEDLHVRQSFDVCATVGEALNLLPTIVPATVKPRIQLDPDTGLVFGDAEEIQTVVMNLIFNAVDAMEGKIGEIEISLSAIEVGDGDDEAGPRLEAGRYARFSVADSGCGMDAQTLEHIFEPFYTTKGIGEGSGFGFSSAYGIVTQHGGSIRSSSTLGQGAQFHVYLPLSDRLSFH